MNALLVGADTLGNIPDTLAAFGINIARHISGRNASHQRRLPSLPKGTDIMILFTDFLGHNVMRHFRDLANEHNIQIVTCRRSVCALKESLSQLELQSHDPCAGCKSHSGTQPGKRKCN
ncbi:DUF2325 domain-containing protein [Chitinivorax sp. B]|uniref:DUF2325 domain-containing protein n=1 Tax=Chitinivorax sp. B TaxID=2502235 RepID=UPI0010F4C50C|nr:DUF2325 domain-containing protein [Chitinivorax sp. B]